MLTRPAPTPRARSTSALAAPRAAVQVQQAEARQVAGVGVDLAAEDEVAESVGARQRIAHACQLKNLSADALPQYIEHRLHSAGYDGPVLFDDAAIRRIYKKTRGVPRLINLLCNKAMMLSFAAGDFYISEKHIKLASKDTQQLGRMFSKAQVASALYMSVRTLHNRLAKSGTNYQKLLDETRQGLAEQYMRQPDISVSEIAYLLGFSDCSNFSRAFQRWTDRAPSQYSK